MQQSASNYETVCCGHFSGRYAKRNWVRALDVSSVTFGIKTAILTSQTEVVQLHVYRCG